MDTMTVNVAAAPVQATPEPEPVQEVLIGGQFNEDSIDLTAGEISYPAGMAASQGSPLVQVTYQIEGWAGEDENNRYCALPSLKLPKGYIQGTVGAGDAFCAGVLCGAEKGFELSEAIRLGVAAAACSLSKPGATEGMRPIAEAMKLYDELGVR